jgi:hypothetical protein
MRHFNATVFDEFVPSALATSPVYTSADLNTRLAQYDQIALQLIIDNFTVSTTVTIDFQHSADGRNWISKPNQAGLFNNLGTPSNAITAPGPTILWTYDNGGTPSLGLMRIAFSTAIAAPLHLKLHVTARDSH